MVTLNGTPCGRTDQHSCADNAHLEYRPLSAPPERAPFVEPGRWPTRRYGIIRQRATGNPCE